MCFWCDEKFIPGHTCRNKRLSSLCIMEENEGFTEDETSEKGLKLSNFAPHISLDALEGTLGLNTMKVTEWLDKMIVSILIDSSSTHNFINSVVALKLHLQLTTIKPMIVQAVNGERMVCKSLCKGLRWKMQGISFMADVFIIKLSNCGMVLGIQWLSLSGDILCNYKHLWISFDWQGQRVLLKWKNLPKLQYIELEQLSSLVRSHDYVDGYHLCNLKMVEDEDGSISISLATSPQLQSNAEDQLQSISRLPRLISETKRVTTIQNS